MKIKSNEIISREGIMQVTTQKQVMALQNKTQEVADKLTEEVIFITKDVQHIQVQAGTAYQLNAKDFDAKKSSLIAKKVDDDLEVALEEGVIIATFCALFCNAITCFCVFTCIITSLDFDLMLPLYYLT
jgi:hypothetical protein